jgi:cell division protein FtsB
LIIASDNQVSELEDNKEYYQQEIKKTKKIKQLNNPEQIEKYAREKYYMKRTAKIFTS